MPRRLSMAGASDSYSSTQTALSRKTSSREYGYSSELRATDQLGKILKRTANDRRLHESAVGVRQTLIYDVVLLVRCRLSLPRDGAGQLATMHRLIYHGPLERASQTSPCGPTKQNEEQSK